jgi:hypothetical protein
MEMMPDEEFNILAALQALDTLDESETRALTEKLRASPQLQSERAAFEAAIAAIAYTAPSSRRPRPQKPRVPAHSRTAANPGRVSQFKANCYLPNREQYSFFNRASEGGKMDILWSSGSLAPQALH